MTYTCENCKKEFERKLPFRANEILCNGCLISKRKLEKFKDPKNKKEFLEKQKTTNIKKYGCSNVAQVPEIKEKYISTNLKNNGYIGAFSNPKYREKIQKAAHSEEAYQKKLETNRRKYNADHFMESKEGKKIYQKTLLQKTGYRNPMQNPKTAYENHVQGYKFEDIHFDSSWELAFYIWLRDNKKAFIYHPKQYLDYLDDKGTSRVYQPDFLIEGQFYEIKGDQFFNEKGEPFNRYTKEYWWEKYKALLRYNVKILKLEDIKIYLKYIKDVYGKNYLKQYKIKFNDYRNDDLNNQNGVEYTQASGSGNLLQKKDEDIV